MTKFRSYPVVLLLTLSASILLIPSCASTSKEMTAKDLVAEAEARVKTIPISEAKAKHDGGGVLFLDAREPNEFKAGHIPGAMNIPRGLVEFQITQKVPDKTTIMMVYCKSGGRSALTSASLVRMGYTNVLNIQGGWNAWMKAGYPVE